MPENTLTITDNRTGQTYTVPVEDGTIRAMNLRQIKTGPEDFGLMTYDPAFMNTASCRSSITYIDGDRGILRYRGYPIEVLAERCTFLEVAYLLLFGELPTKSELQTWVHDITHHTMLHESIKKFMEGFRYDSHPMGMFVSTVAALSSVYPEAREIHDPKNRMHQIIRLIGKVPSIAALSYRHNVGFPYVYPDNDLSYTENFMNMLWKMVEPKYVANPVLSRALDILFILHADHEQNCGTSAMRTVGSAQTDPYLATASAAAALAGPLHGGANEEVRARKADGLRPSRLQELRSAGEDHQVDRGTGFPGYGSQREVGHRSGIGTHRVGRRVFCEAQALSQRRFLFWDHVSGDGLPTRDVYRAVRHSAHCGMAGAVAGISHRPGAEDYPTAPDLYRLRRAAIRAHGEAHLGCRECGLEEDAW
jgi:hypothetical protein